jgi:hypothetical protein
MIQSKKQKRKQQMGRIVAQIFLSSIHQPKMTIIMKKKKLNNKSVFRLKISQDYRPPQPKNIMLATTSIIEDVSMGSVDP